MKRTERAQGVLEFLMIGFMLAIVVIAFYLLLLPLMQKAMAQANAVAWPDVTIPSNQDHEYDRHGQEGITATAVTCFGGYGTVYMQSFLRDRDNHRARICEMDGKFFVWIVDEIGNTVTRFRNKGPTVSDVAEYLGRRGYK